MKKQFCLFPVFIILSAISGKSQDTAVNNLVHSQDYKASAYGAIPHYTRTGKGKKTCILIPGFGFGASVFDDFIETNRHQYTIYAITIPGYGTTNAPPMPATDTSYGQQYWTNSIIAGIMTLIEKENIQRPVLIGHFVQGTQLALRIAMEQPGKISSVVILGGPAKFIAVDKDGPKQYPLASTIKYIDQYWAPKFYKTISHSSFNAGNYLPEIYSLDSAKGAALWKQSASQPLPVMIRYLCEFFSSDVTLTIDKIKCPVLVLRPTFSADVLQRPINSYVRPQFIDTWTELAKKNPRITIIDIPGAASFIWKDQPAKVYQEIKKMIDNEQ